MGKIKESRETIFTTSDGEKFTEKRKANNHQMDISERSLTPPLIKFIEKMYNLPSNEAINDLFDSDDDKDYAKGEKLEKKLNEFLNDSLGEMGWVDDMDDLAGYLIGTYRAFGVEDMSKLFKFIHDKLDM